MKKVEAVIRETKFSRVSDALRKLGINDISIEPTPPKLKIAVIVQDEMTSQVVSTIEAAARI